VEASNCISISGGRIDCICYLRDRGSARLAFRSLRLLLTALLLVTVDQLLIWIAPGPLRHNSHLTTALSVLLPLNFAVLPLVVMT
jgi:hypothetical protein